MKQVIESHTPSYGMVVDLNRCVGCQTCTIACKQANDTQPDVQWRRVIDVESGRFPDVSRLFMVTGCQHCKEPSCVPVCPTGATKKREDGLVTIDYDMCIGCASCAVACPYQARTIAHKHQWYYGEETAQEVEARHPEREGVAQKCTFCVNRIDEAKDKGLTPGVDWGVTPACAASCITQAIQFGDFNDPDSNVSRLARDNETVQMHKELGNDPQIKYMYTTPIVPGRIPTVDDLSDERLGDPENALVGKLQKFWDWRAAMNWCFGGVSTGAVFVLWLWSLITPMAADAHAAVNTLFAGLMGVGLFFVFLKIGRKLRFWRAVSRPQTSWMTRELYAVLLFGPPVLIGLIKPSGFIFAWTAIAALAFLFCQARILQAAKGIPNWRVPLMPWMIMATGLLEGFGLVSIIAPHLTASTDQTDVNSTLAVLPLVGAALAVINAALWSLYRSTAKAAGIGPLSRAAIAETSLKVHLIGHVLPLGMFLLAFFLPGAGSLFLFIGGAAAIAGGFLKKFTIIVRASYQQGFALSMLPQRGSGANASPELIGNCAITRG